jgi:5-methylcytosine-specific restriction endonuclease McrA
MKRAIILAAALLLVAPAEAKHHHSAHNRHGCNATETWDCRSLTVKHQFWKLTGHPHGWKGHIVDHRIPLDCGGRDAVENMQWQTTAEAKAKDAWETIGCRNGKRVGQPGHPF